MKHLRLWVPDHPYYCNEGNYYKPGHHHEYASWATFMREFGDSDPELNLVYRWDWRREWDDDTSDYHPTRPGTKLLVFAMLQRKGICQSYEVSVLPDDEPAIRAWLIERLRHLLAVWTPLLPATVPEDA